MKQKRSILQSLNHAADGFIHVLKTERNMRIHLFLGFAVLVFAIFLGVDRLEFILLCSVISLVLITEMVNTCIEETVDMIEGQIHPVARIIKDASAGAVLVSAVNALIVGFLIISAHWSWPLNIVLFQVKYAPWHVTFIALLFVIFFVIVAKAFYRRGTPFRGGAVSGHSAVAFAFWTAVLYTQQNLFVILATLCLALLVAQSRLRAKIHSFVEVIAGALVGGLATATLFRFFS